MILVWRLALRDLRRGGRGLWLLAICLFLGTAALAGVGSLSASMLGALADQGRTLQGGDLEMRVSQRRATVEETAAFAAAGRMSETVTLRAMASVGSGGVPTLIELRGVDDAWPLVGRFRLAPGALKPRPHGREIAVSQALADRLDLRVGQVLTVGSTPLRIIGIVAQEPDRLGAGFSLGPPVLVDMAGLDATQLVQPGSLYESHYRILLSRPDAAEALGERLVARFPNSGWTARTADRAAGGLRRGIGQLGQFLLLVSLAALAIAGLGIGNAVAAYLAGKTRTIATLKVLGATSGTAMAVFLVQLGVIAGAGVLAGLSVGAAVPWIVVAFAGSALPVAPRVALYPLPLGVAAALGLLVALLFAIPPLSRARLVPAATLLRDAVAPSGRTSWPAIAAMVAIAALLFVLAVASASDPLMAAEFLGATAALLLLLWLLGWGVRALAARVPRPRFALARLAIGNLHRPGAQTVSLISALGLGFSLFVALTAIDTSLTAELTGAAPAKAPRFFAIDLQPEDAARFRQVVGAAAPGATFEMTPSLRGSITALRGVPVASMRNAPDSWVLRGDRTLTWAADVPPRNTVVAGQWWPRDYHGPPLVSIEDSAAEALGLHVGDTITVSVLGVDVPARIAALRHIDWSGLGLNFAIVFSPGYIEEAPHGLLASVYSAPDRDGVVARDVAAALPSVTLVRVGDVIGQIGAVLAQLVTAIRVAAAVTVAAGIAVLVGAVTASGRTRRYDIVILKLLGGSSRQALAVQAMEYGLLSLVLAAVALAVGCGAAWYVVTQVFTLAWAPDWGAIALTLGGSVVITLGIGLLGSIPALRARPAAALRAP